MLLDRRRRAGHWLEWKVRVFAVGAVLGIVGIYLDERWMTGAAIVILALGMFLRLLPRQGRGHAGDDGDAAGDGEDAPGPGRAAAPDDGPPDRR